MTQPLYFLRPLPQWLPGLLILLLVGLGGSAQPIRYVRAGGVGDGSSWANASGNLQAMIDAAGVEQVWVAAGTYKPTSTAARDISFSMKNGVAIYGGFPGTGNPIFTDRNPASFTTILSGDIGTVGDNGDNTYVVIKNTGLDNTAILDGFVVTGGQNIAPGDGRGGGIFNSASSPILRNCSIVNNAANLGGGCYNQDSPNLILTNCALSGNSAGSGGGIHNAASNMILTNCTLSSNSAVGGPGGGIFSRDGSRLSLTNCTLNQNTAVASGGGFFGTDGPDQTFTNCIFQNNSAPIGGGLFVLGTGNLILNSCLIRDNVATDDAGGGLFAGGGVSTAMTSCTITGNRTVDNGAGIANLSTLRMASCVISNNVADKQGGGLAHSSGDAQLLSCLITGNSALGAATDGYGGGAIWTVSSLTLANSTLAGNTAPAGEGGNALRQSGDNTSLSNCIIYDNGSNGQGTFVVAGGSITATYSLIQPGETDFSGSNNFLPTRSSPFVGPKDYRISPCSSTINAGDPASTTATSGSLDVAGNPRFFQGGRVDPGAYEYQGTPTVAITGGPASGTIVVVGSPVRAVVSVSGTVSGYQWYKDGAAVSGQTSATLTLPSAQTSDAGSYSLAVTGACNQVNSGVFSLSVVERVPIRYVKVGGVGDGSSWARASGDLQAMINAVGVEQVWVAAGTYKPTPTTDRNISFVIPSGVRLYGGFVGTETHLTDRNWATNPTILSGEVNQPSNFDNVYHVVRFDHVSEATLLDGFTIRDGVASGPTGPFYHRGGGIYNDGSGSGGSSTPTIQNCIITANETRGGGGGGLYNDGSGGGQASPLLINCVLAANTIGSGAVGAAVYNNGTGGTASPRFMNCTLANNRALVNSSAGGIYNEGMASPVLTNCIVYNNSGTGSLPHGISGGSPSVTYSILQEGANAANHVLDADPLFVTGAYSLTMGSPAINAGDLTAYTALVGAAGLDLAHNSRIQYGLIDLGAIESAFSFDLTPILYAQPASLYGPSDLTIVVDVVEVGGVASQGPIVIKVSRDARLSLSLDPRLTTIGSHQVQNSQWSLSGPADGFYTLTSTAVIAGGDKLSIGLMGMLNPGATTGRMTVTALLVSNPDSEGVLSNNTDAEKLDYFQQ